MSALDALAMGLGYVVLVFTALIAALFVGSWLWMKFVQAMADAYYAKEARQREAERKARS